MIITKKTFIMGILVLSVNSANTAFAHFGNHGGGPHIGGPHIGGPHIGGPHIGGPQIGGPHVVVGMPHEHGWFDHRGRNFGWYQGHGLVWNNGNYWFNHRRCYWDAYRNSFVYYDDGLDIAFQDQPVVVAPVPPVVVRMPHEHGWLDHRGRNFGWYQGHGLNWNNGDYWYHNRRCHWDANRYSFVYDDGLGVDFQDQPAVVAPVPPVAVGMPHENGWQDNRGRHFGWYRDRGLSWNNGDYWYNNRRCYWNPNRYSFVDYDSGVDIEFPDQPVMVAPVIR